MTHKNHIITAAVGAVVGVAILTLAVPRLVVEMKILLVTPILENIQNKVPVPLELALSAHQTLMDVVTWSNSADTWLQKSMIEIYLSGQVQTEDERTKWLEQATESVTTALARAPGNPYAWTKLAYLRYNLDEQHSSAKEPLVMAMITGPYERTLVQSYVAMGLSLWDDLSDEEQAIVREEILRFARHDRKKLVKFARASKKNARIIFASLAKDRDMLKTFMRQYLTYK